MALQNVDVSGHAFLRLGAPAPSQLPAALLGPARAADGRAAGMGAVQGQPGAAEIPTPSLSRRAAARDIVAVFRRAAQRRQVAALETIRWYGVCMQLTKLCKIGRPNCELVQHYKRAARDLRHQLGLCREAFLASSEAAERALGAKALAEGRLDERASSSALAAPPSPAAALDGIMAALAPGAAAPLSGRPSAAAAVLAGATHARGSSAAGGPGSTAAGVVSSGSATLPPARLSTGGQPLIPTPPTPPINVAPSPEAAKPWPQPGRPAGVPAGRPAFVPSLPVALLTGASVGTSPREAGEDTGRSRRSSNERRDQLGASPTSTSDSDSEEEDSLTGHGGAGADGPGPAAPPPALAAVPGLSAGVFRTGTAGAMSALSSRGPGPTVSGVAALAAASHGKQPEQARATSKPPEPVGTSPGPPSAHRAVGNSGTAAPVVSGATPTTSSAAVPGGPPAGTSGGVVWPAPSLYTPRTVVTQRVHPGTPMNLRGQKERQARTSDAQNRSTADLKTSLPSQHGTLQSQPGTTQAGAVPGGSLSVAAHVAAATAAAAAQSQRQTVTKVGGYLQQSPPPEPGKTITSPKQAPRVVGGAMASGRMTLTQQQQHQHTSPMQVTSPKHAPAPMGQTPPPAAAATQQQGRGQVGPTGQQPGRTSQVASLRPPGALQTIGLLTTPRGHSQPATGNSALSTTVGPSPPAGTAAAVVAAAGLTPRRSPLQASGPPGAPGVAGPSVSPGPPQAAAGHQAQVLRTALPSPFAATGPVPNSPLDRYVPRHVPPGAKAGAGPVTSVGAALASVAGSVQRAAANLASVMPQQVPQQPLKQGPDSFEI